MKNAVKTAIMVSCQLSLRSASCKELVRRYIKTQKRGIFMKKRESTPPWRSKLIPFQREILSAWYQDRKTLRQIQSFLLEKGITISMSAISNFIRCRKRSTDPHIPGKPLPVLSKPETPPIADSLLDELTSKSLPELQEEWFKGISERKRKNGME